eukprot:ANDGO_07699.mRNA.1 hypothetical protein SDRG_06721
MRRREQWTSSLPFQMLLFCGAYFTVPYLIINLADLIYKGVLLPYPSSSSSSSGGDAYGWEIAFLFIYAFVESVRLLLGNMGNKLERIRPLIGFLVLSVGIIVANVYYMSLQIYVLQLDFVIGAIMLAVNCTQMLLCLVTMYSIKRVHSFA